MSTNDIPSTINKTLDVLAARFGATGEALWHSLVLYCRIYAMGWIVFGAGVSAAIFWMSYRWEPDNDDLYFVKYIGYVASILACLLFVATNLADVLMPQAGVIVWIMSQQ